MSRVNGSGRPGGPNTNDEKKRPQKQEKKKAMEHDSSDESQSAESSGEGRKSGAVMKPKLPPKEKEVRIAPNSTSYKKEESTDPGLRPSGKREAFQRKVKHETEIGSQSRHRRREIDFKGNYPELTSMQKAQRKKDFENKPASLDPVKLVEQAKSARGHLRVQVNDKKDVKVLADVLSANPSIRSLDLVGDFGGRSNNPGDMTRSQRQSWVIPQRAMTVQSNWPDTDSFRSILDACKNVEALNLKACRLTGKDWYSLAAQLQGTSKLRRLEFGGNIEISESGLESISSAIASRDSSLRELVIDDLSVNQFSFDKLSKAIKKHGNFSLIKLQNISNRVLIGNFADIDLMFDICTSNPKLQYFSLVGTKFQQFSAANDLDYLPHFGKPEVSVNALNFRKHACLRIFDLSGCELEQAAMGEIAAACDGHAALIEVRIEGNKISDSDLAKLDATTTPNRRRLEAQATVAYDLLVTHAAGEMDVWPEELSRMLVQNTPVEILPNIAAVVAPGSGPSAQPSAPTNIRNPKNSARWSTTDKPSKNQ
jgi:hypothetical protein